MTTNSFPQSNDQDPAAQATHLVQDLLDRVIRATEAGSLGGESPLVGTRLAGTLRTLIERVRNEYRLLADREIAQALETALGIEIALNPQTSDQPLAAPDAFDALEALIMGIETDSHAGHDDSAVPIEDFSAVPAEPVEVLYEGTVRLYVNAQGHMQRVIRFVDDIGQRPQFRVLRMTGNPQREGAEIDLGLREPTAFLELLRSMGHAAEPVDDANGGIPQVNVRLHSLVTA
jgi:hypothetical protein